MRDDGPQLQRLLNAAGPRVVIPPGAYAIARPLVLLDRRGLDVDGRGATIRVADGTPTDTGDGDTLKLIGCNGVRVTGLSFDGNAKNRPPAPQTNPATLRIQGCADVEIASCRFADDALDGVFVWCATDPTKVEDASQYVRITGCTFDRPGRNGISVIHGRYVRIDHNTFRSARRLPPACGIDIEPNPGDADGITHHVSVEYNTLVDCAIGVAVIKSANPRSVSILGNSVDGCDTGIFNEGQGVLISHNVVTRSAVCDISSCNGATATVAGNLASNVYVEAGSVWAEAGK